MKRTSAKYSDGTDVVLPEVPRFSAYFRLAKESWLIITAGWLFVLLSFVISWEEPASGAVLVGCSIAAELFFMGQRWRKMPVDVSGRVQLEKETHGFPIIWGPVVMAPAGSGQLGALISLSKTGEVHNITGHKSPYWTYRDTAERVEVSITYVLASSALFGTILWGYGHLIFS